MQSHVFRFPARCGQPVRWFLCSDLHLGHVGTDVARIKQELQRAADLKARILINGDVFDAVTCGDKRFTPGQTIRRIAEARDALKATVDYGYEILAPYREFIDVIGIGNHEETWIKYRQSDPVSYLCERLSDPGHRVRHGGIAGYVVSLLDVPSGEGKPLTLSHYIRYHHGSGGDAPVTGGLIAANRGMVGWHADCHTQGHRHNALVREYAVGMCRPNGRIVHKQCLAVMTASYLNNYPAGSQKRPLDVTYAESSDHPPKPMGGVFVYMTPTRVKRGKRDYWEVRQDYHSSLLPVAAVA